MRNGYLMVAALALAGCASDAYRYHDGGYWTAREAQRVSVSYSIGYSYGGACSLGYSGYGYPRFGYGWSSCGYGYSPWYGGAGFGYWSDPYWSQRWYLLPRTIEAPRAGARARALASDSDPVTFPRYEDLAPTRQRDLGGGDRAWRVMSAPERGSVASQQGLGSVRYERSSGMSGGFGNRESGSSRSSGFSARAPGMSAGSAARSSSRDTREED